MPRSGSGVYSLPAGNPVVAGTTIQSTWANSTLTDVGDALTGSLARDGSGGMTGALRVADGSEAVPGVAFSNETGSGLYRAGTGDYSLAVQGAKTLQLTSTGVTIPSGKAINLDGTTNLVNFSTASTPASAVGRLGWNQTDGTLNLGLIGGNVSLQIGQEQVQRVLNNTGSGMVSGNVVYITGAQGNRKTVALANGNSEATSTATFGVVTESIANNAEGFVTTNGYVRDLDTSAFAEGAVLWLSASVAGAITATRPVAPNHGVRVGFCVKSHASNGIIYVDINNGYELDELHDVKITSIANKQFLQWNAAQSVWENVSSLDVGGNVTASGNASVGGTLGVTGNTTMSGTLGVTGNASMSGTLGVTGAVTMGAGSTMTGSGSNVSFYLTNTGSGGNSFRWILGQTGDAVAGGIGLFDNTAGAYRMAVSSTGDVGFGTTSPGAKVDVAGVLLVKDGASATDGTKITSDNSGNTSMYQFYNGYMRFGTNNTERVRIHASGGVSVGNTTDPGATNLSVTGSISDSSGQLRPLVQATSQASTSGAAIDFTGIPAWVKRVTVVFSGVSTNGTSPVIIQAGAGSVTTSGYSSTGANWDNGGTAAVTTSTGGFLTAGSGNATYARTGIFVLSNLTGNTWVCSGSLGDAAGATTQKGDGVVTLSGVLDRVRITTTGGVNTFDAGSINILYE